MRKQTKKFLTLITLFFIVLFIISCNKDNTENKGIVGRIKGIISIFKKDKGIERYAGVWIEANSEIPIPVFEINLDGSITISPHSQANYTIEDIKKFSDIYYEFTDVDNSKVSLEFKNNKECVMINYTSDDTDFFIYELIKEN